MSRQEHSAKLAALWALRQGRLSSAGQARLQAHLQGCDVCREQNAALGAYAELLEQATQGPLPEPDWGGIGQRLDQQAASLRRQRRLRVVAPALLAAAAVLLGMRPWTPEAAPVARTGGGTVSGQPQVPQAAALLPVVTLRAGPDLPALREGSLLITEPDGRLEIRLSPGTGFVLEGDSRVRLVRLREGDVLLELQRGRLVNQVLTLGASQRYVVAAGPYRVRVRGTHFAVAVKPGQQVDVTVVEGLVEVTAGAESPLAQLRAGSALSLPWQPGAHEPALAQGESSLEHPLALQGPLAQWPELWVPVMPDAVRWTIAGRSLERPGQIRMRVPRGDVALQVELRDGRMMGTTLAMGEGPTRLQLSALVPLEAPRVRPRQRPVDTAQMAAVVRDGREALQRCYELSLKRQPDIEPRMRLRITMDSRGRVRRARLVGQNDVPAGLGECISRVAGRWQFPATAGDGLTFDAPLSFRRRM